MSTAYVVVTILAAVWVAFSAGSVFFRAAWVTEPLAEYGIPQSWWPWLGIAKTAGALGLLIGLAAPIIGVLAVIGLVLYFVGALITVARARSYFHLPYPLLYLVPVLVAAGLGIAA